ncbi:hypothetical protein MAR_014346 [Mya arenaria]|uniref:Uncharacterized protein n=1 Tax=Mya arenaria TaxID=6604 RepID=A0ABY7G2H4_MYAAR|nr:hypothetical protein MAR_014346 [Mya arenaria]
MFGYSWVSLVAGGRRWSMVTDVNLKVKKPGGRVNNSPTVDIPAIIHFHRGCSHVLKLPDIDGDNVRCRKALSNDECGDVCQSFDELILNEDTCTLHYTPSKNSNTLLGFYAIAIQIEDYEGNERTPLSSIPLQFLLKLDETDNCTEPSFLPPTPEHEQCFRLNVGETAICHYLIPDRNAKVRSYTRNFKPVGDPRPLEAAFVSGSEIIVTLNKNLPSIPPEVILYTQQTEYVSVFYERFSQHLVRVHFETIPMDANSYRLRIPDDDNECATDFPDNGCSQICRAGHRSCIEGQDIDWDVYRDDRLKSHIMHMRGSGDTVRVLSNTVLPLPNWKSFLKNDKNKSSLFNVLSKSIAGMKTTNIVLTTLEQTGLQAQREQNENAEIQQVDTLSIEACTKEEVDYRMLLHTIHAFSIGYTGICITSTDDADVVVLAVAIASMYRDARIWIAYVHNKNLGYIPAHLIANDLGSVRKWGLLFLHAVTGCDYVSPFSGIGMKSAFNIWKDTARMA